MCAGLREAQFISHNCLKSTINVTKENLDYRVLKCGMCTFLSDCI